MNKTSVLTAAVAMASMVMLPVAHAETNPDAPALTTKSSRTTGRDIHVGVNFRTDFGARYYRADVGMRFGRWDVSLVLDPLGIPNGDYDFDAILRRVGETWSVWGGARLSVTPIARSHQFTEKLLLGVSAELPSFNDNVRIHSGLELAVHVRAHGADIMTRWVCVDAPDCREDHFVFGLFGRVEYASPL